MTMEQRATRTPAALLPYQQRWMADESKVKVCEKSRRIGLSWAEACDSALTAASESGMDCWYIGYNKDMSQEFIEDCADWARHFHHAAAAVEEFVFNDEEKDILAFRIRFQSGWKVVALSSRPSNLRGKQGKIIIDEAAFHDDLPGLLKAAMAMLMWGGRVVVVSTHNGDDHPFNELVSDIRAGKKPYALHRITLDDAIRDGLYQRICLRLGKDWAPEGEAAWRDDLIEYYGEDADEELFCIPAKGSGVYLPRAVIEACMDPGIPVIRWSCKDDFAELPEYTRRQETEGWCKENLDQVLARLDPHAPSYFGEDFGRSGDLTVVFPLQEMRNLLRRAPFVLELRNVPFRQQEQVLFYICDRMPRFCGGAMDARGNGQYLAEVAMQRYGRNRIIQVMLSNEWYRDNMPRYKASFEDRTILIPKDGDLLDDHRAIRMEKGIAKVPDNLRSKGRDGKQRHGDSAIAGALADFAVSELAGMAGVPEILTARSSHMMGETTSYFNGARYSAY